MHDVMDNIIRLIEEGDTPKAVTAWADTRGARKSCSPCFYSPLDQSVRCANCLDSHLSHAGLKRTYAHIGSDRVENAHKRLRDWLRDRHVA